MFNASPDTTTVIPCNQGSEEELGPVVNDAYFGKVPSQRLIVKDNALFFKTDGAYRSKVGLGPSRAQAILGSYDAVSKVLTLVQYNKPGGQIRYVNSMWEFQDDLPPRTSPPSRLDSEPFEVPCTG